jgi:mRNA-degrading endonuclease RelE of RelBE toxin-antitoxin system
MTLKFTISPELERRLDKLAHKDKPLALAVRKKIQQIISCDKTTIIHHFKNLRGGMSNYKRVHIGSFVLFFKLEKDALVFDRFVHHGKAY